ncbi:MAG: SDR family oxidoreductase [Gammaproteobacteria bacterium]|nr:SDR family oxidoreductase [Gammaproteobacteria bacterium]
MDKLAEQHAVVTGGGSGIGAAIAASLAQTGMSVTLFGRDVERLAAKAAELDASYQAADVTERQQLSKAFAAAEQEHGAITILVNNAGAADAIAFAKMDDDRWDRVLAVNLTGVYNCTRLAIGPMLEAGTGRIINVASTAALTGYAYVSAYCAAKHGVLGLTRALAREYAQKGITVNAVCPGYTDTDIVRQAIDNIVATTGRSKDEALVELVKTNPQGRLIQPEEVAETVLWLCSQDSMTGQAIAVAGGEIM